MKKNKQVKKKYKKAICNQIYCKYFLKQKMRKIRFIITFKIYIFINKYQEIFYYIYFLFYLIHLNFTKKYIYINQFIHNFSFKKLFNKNIQL